MKKIGLIILIAVFSLNVNAQWYGKKIRGNGDMVTKTRNVGDYDRIAVGGSFDVNLVSGTEGKLTVRIDENLLEYLITEVEGDKLRVKWKKGVNIYSKSKIVVTVPFEDISSVTLAGSGDVYSEDIIKADDFKTAISGSGDIKLKVDANDLSSSVSGSGDISLSGNANTLDCSISGSGGIRAYDLVSNKADVSIAGSGGMRINVKDELKARIAGSGNIYYKGNPARQDVKVSGSGNVSSK